jgi:hypothetical protein
MSSQYARTHTTSAPPRESGQPVPAQGRSSGLSIGTLVAAAISSAIAATVVSRLWQSGTIMATAMTPVIVALVKEAIERPAQRVSSIASRTASPRVARATRTVAPPAPETEAPPPPVVAGAQLSAMRVYRRERRVGRRWKLAIATGLLAFAIAAAAMTLPELVAGRSVVSSKHDTTIFGGHRRTSTTKHDVKTTSTEHKTTSTDEQLQNTTSTQQPDTTTTAPPSEQQQTQPAPQQQTQPAPQQETQPSPTKPQPATPQQQPAPATP